jgi:ABC-type multidrug transport system fused ATPase/permease subunit
MENNTETLLVILITILSTLAIVALAVFIALILLLRKVIKNVNDTAVASRESLDLLKRQLAKSFGVFSLLRMFARRRR